MLVSVVTSCDTKLPTSTKWRLMRPLIGAATVHQSKLSCALDRRFRLQHARRRFIAGAESLVQFLLADGSRVLFADIDADLVVRLGLDQRRLRVLHIGRGFVDAAL